ncbi:MAG: hypothetical protein EBZ67_16420, partial [Chitinophagia bacterium]|nr:hypothetical protein [Chitinophagia bacterium]
TKASRPVFSTRRVADATAAPELSITLPSILPGAACGYAEIVQRLQSARIPIDFFIILSILAFSSIGEHVFDRTG